LRRGSPPCQCQITGPNIVVADGLNAPGFVQCTSDGLWITEDATHMARVPLLDTGGQLQIILTHLRSAQSIIPLAAGRQLPAGSTGGVDAF
jgi:hypothetical protein